MPLPITSKIWANYPGGWKSGEIAAPPAWTPLDITGCVLWLDASQISGLSNGDDVSSWTDLASANHAVQGTAASKPHYTTNVLNGLPSVRFDGTDDTMQCGVSCFSGAGARTVIVVYDDNRTSGTSTIVGQSSVDDTRHYFHIQSRDSYDPCISCWADDLWITHAFYNTPRIITATYNGNVTGALYQNGAKLGDKTWGAPLGTDDVGFMLSYSHYPNEYQTGDSFEIIVYSTALSDADRGVVELYLSTKWGIALA